MQKRRNARDHVAIMDRSWGLLDKLARGEKTIESRWYRTRRIPWGRIEAGDTVYFKNTGEPITLRATVARVEALCGLTPKQTRVLVRSYAPALGIAPAKLPQFLAHISKKTYCILIFLTHVRPVTPFWIDKRGFGTRAAWVTVPRIESIMRAVDSQA